MVSAAGIAEGLRALGAGGTPPRLLIVDDGWQQTDVDPAYRQIGGQLPRQQPPLVRSPALCMRVPTAVITPPWPGMTGGVGKCTCLLS